MRIESNLRRLEGVRSVRSSVVDDIVTVLWKPGVPLNVAQLEEAVVRWRGGVRYGGAVVTVVGVMEPADSSAGRSAPRLLKATGTGQLFRLRSGAREPDPSALHTRDTYRVTGQVIRSGRRKCDEIWLDLRAAAAISRQSTGQEQKNETSASR